MNSVKTSLATKRRANGISPQFYTIKEAAAMIGIHPWTLWDWIKNKKRNAPPFRRFGPTTIRIPKEKFHEYLNGE